MLIKNYGLYWRREDVYWSGNRAVAGNMRGIRASSRRSKPVDFRYQIGIYVLYDENLKIVYTGQSGRGNSRLFFRLRQHTSDHLADRWNRFSWFGMRGIIDDDELEEIKSDINISTDIALNHIEAILIYSSEPPLNRQGGKFGNEVKQYLQYRDEENLGPSLNKMVQDIWGDMQE